MAVATGDRAPEFDLEVTHGERVRLSEFAGRSNVLLVTCGSLDIAGGTPMRAEGEMRQCP